MRKIRKSTFLLPSAFTSGNVLTGFYSIVSAIRGDLELACWLVLVAMVLDFLDGKVAMFSRTETRFGIELDSLADIISFCVAPGIIMYQFFLRQHGELSWMVSFLYVLCGALRLARFNVETSGAGKTKFKGLPTPVAAAAIIGFVPFSRTEHWFNLFQDVNYTRFLVLMLLMLAGLMVSNVEYPAVPRFNIRSLKGGTMLFMFLVLSLLMLYFWNLLLFPLAFLYITWGLGRSILLGAISRLPERDSGGPRQ